MNLDRPTWHTVRKGDVFMIPRSAEPGYSGATYLVVDVSQRPSSRHNGTTKLTVLMSSGAVECWSALRDDDYMPDVLLREGQ